jgi:hypothetical protein
MLSQSDACLLCLTRMTFVSFRVVYLIVTTVVLLLKNFKRWPGQIQKGQINVSVAQLFVW